MKKIVLMCLAIAAVLACNAQKSALTNISDATVEAAVVVDSSAPDAGHDVADSD